MSALYFPTLWLHSQLRWLVLVACVLAFAWALQRRLRGADFGVSDMRVARGLVGVVDLQLLLGLVLYTVLSPLSSTGFRDPRAALGHAELRHFLIEHPFGVVAIHWGFARAKRLHDSAKRHRSVAISAALGLFCFLAALPWSRPFLRGFP